MEGRVVTLSHNYKRPRGGKETGRVYLRKGMGVVSVLNIVGGRNYKRSLDMQAAGLASQAWLMEELNVHGLIYFYKESLGLNGKIEFV